MGKSIIIIGGGVAGLATGCYTQMNGYQTRIFEMHNKPGGVCTAWTRKGYTIDGCLHWLVGSAPGHSFYKYWRELGMLQGRQVINMDRFYEHTSVDGRTFTLYSDADRLEQHMLEISPEDTAHIKTITRAIRHLTKFGIEVEKPQELQNAWDKVKMMSGMLPYLGDLRRFSGKNMGDIAAGFKDPFLRSCWDFYPKDFSAFGFLMNMASLHNKLAGYVIGGSLPLMRAVENRYREIGGQIIYKSRVQKIIVENNRAVGIKLEGGEEYRADYVISAADGHTTIFNMLEGKYADDTARTYYDNLPVFNPIVYVGLGVNRTFNDVPQFITGMTMALDKPIRIGGRQQTMLQARVHNFDLTLAPAGKTVITLAIEDDYEYWKQLSQDPAKYTAEKAKVAGTVISLLERRFPGITRQVEMTDVATPVTFERYTGNWKGCYEGFLITPKTMMLRMKKTLPGLDGFYMVGQWVSPGGGLPSGVITGRQLTQVLCKHDGIKFTTLVPQAPPPNVAKTQPKETVATR